MKKKKIETVEAEAAQGGFEGLERALVALIVVPQLAGDEDLLAQNSTVAHRDADVLLVAVNARGVDVSVGVISSRTAACVPSPRGDW